MGSAECARVAAYASAPLHLSARVRARPGALDSASPMGGESRISTDDVRHVARLARIAMPESRVETMAADLRAIVSHIDKLSSADVDGLEPMAHPSATVNRLADDEPEPGMPLEDLLRNAPDVEGDFLAVPKVIGGDSA